MAIPRCILFFLLCLCYASIDQAQEVDLPTSICQKTSDQAFCRSVMTSDPSIPGADQDFLAYIIFRLALYNATDTQSYIMSKLNDNGERGLLECNADYVAAIGSLDQILDDLNSEYYYDLDKTTSEALESVRDCDAGVGNRRPPLAKRNDDMLKLLDICDVILKLHIYN